MPRVSEILEAAEKVKPIAEKDGKKIVTFEDAVALANMEGIEPTPKTGMRNYNPDGSLAGIRTRAAAINPANYFANRYYMTAKRLKVVVDWRAIHEQASGQIYLSNIPAYVFMRDEKGVLFIEKIETISDAEFVAKYTDSLNEDAMKQIAPLIADYGSDVTATDLPI